MRTHTPTRAQVDAPPGVGPVDSAPMLREGSGDLTQWRADYVAAASELQKRELFLQQMRLAPTRETVLEAPMEQFSSGQLSRCANAVAVSPLPASLLPPQQQLNAAQHSAHRAFTMCCGGDPPIEASSSWESHLGGGPESGGAATAHLDMCSAAAAAATAAAEPRVSLASMASVPSGAQGPLADTLGTPHCSPMAGMGRQSMESSMVGSAPRLSYQFPGLVPVATPMATESTGQPPHLRPRPLSPCDIRLPSQPA